MEIIQTNLFIVVITTISEGVNGCNIYILGKIGVGNRTCYSSPSIVRVSCNGLSILINDSDYITLQVLDEVVGNIVIKNTAYGILVIVKRDKRISVPSLTKNLGAVKRVGMENTVDLLAGSDAVGIVGVLDIVKLLKLTSLFPS